MKRIGKFWWIIPALLIVFLAAAIVTFLGEPKSRLTRESWKTPTTFAVETPHQVVGIAHHMIHEQMPSYLAVKHLTSQPAADSCECQAAGRKEWHPATRVCRAQGA